tara:strand:- start:2131 stop:2268 length:138 start_codon:yes stop_codon:yes gene_type:complete
MIKAGERLLRSARQASEIARGEREALRTIAVPQDQEDRPDMAEAM